MTVGDLFDDLKEKLDSGELRRMDTLYAEGRDSDNSDWFPILELRVDAHVCGIICIDGEIE